MPSDPPALSPFTAALRALMNKHLLTARQIAILTGTSANTIYNWTQGTRPRPLALDRLTVRLAESGVAQGEVQALKDAYHGTRQGFTIFDVGMVASPPEIISSAGNLSGTSRSRNEAVSAFAPDPPTGSGPGPTIRPTGAGFDLETHSAPDAERTDPVQIALHRRLQRHISRLQSAIVRIENTHPTLAAEFTDYAIFLSPDLADLDVPSAWSVGSGLSQQVKTTTAVGPGVMTPELEPDILATFQSLLIDHTAFIQGFAVARDLREQVLRAREEAQDNPDLQEQSEAVLRPMTSVPRLLAAKARHMVNALTRALASAPFAAFDLLASSGEVARNSVVAFAGALHPYLSGVTLGLDKVVLANEVVKFSATAIGIEHLDTLEAAATFLNSNMHQILALYANDQQIADWMIWMAQRLRDLAR
jgi:predicted DNA-binding transcriptional regulator AlpA